VSAKWLASLPKAAFPVVIDPSFTPSTNVMRPRPSRFLAGEGRELLEPRWG
jgi:hypothetical protein